MHDPGRAATPTASVLAWMGAGLFALSLSYFVYRYGLLFGTPVDGERRTGVVVWNVAIFTVFALHHSVFAREAVRSRVERAFGRFERSFYVWLASLLFIAVCKLWQPVPGTIWQVGGPAGALLLFLQIGGIVFSVYSARVLDIWELAGVRQLNSQGPTTNRQALPTPNDQPLPTANPQTGPEFKTTGPYGLVRHPIYLGWFVIVFAVGTMTTTRFVFAVVSCIYLLIAIPFEERSLRKSSGGAYDRYMQLVPRKLVPGLY